MFVKFVVFNIIFNYIYLIVSDTVTGYDTYTHYTMVIFQLNPIVSLLSSAS